MCPHTTIYASSFYYVSSYNYICVLIQLYMCPHTTILVSSYYYVYCTGGHKFQLFFFFFFFPYRLPSYFNFFCFFLASYRWLQISTPNTQLPGVWPMQSHSWAWYNYIYVYIINKNKKAAVGYAFALMVRVQLCICVLILQLGICVLILLYICPHIMLSHSWAWYNYTYVSSCYNIDGTGTHGPGTTQCTTVYVASYYYIYTAMWGHILLCIYYYMWPHCCVTNLI